MRDPFPFPPIPALSKAVEPYAERFSMPTLTLHIHEVVGAALFYTFIQTVVSPVLSSKLFPKHYPRHHRAKKANWDTHVVSLVQSLIINGVALWVMFADEERSSMDHEQRVWGYTGGCGIVQALAAGYFLWDVGITLLNLDTFGLGLLAHGVAALSVYILGFRPFINFYSPTFILYELSTPFLNIHWFCDKLNLTGSKLQLYNGISLLVTFFLCRLVWGTWQSFHVYSDIWHAVGRGPSADYLAKAFSDPSTAADPHTNPMFFAAKAGTVPVWMGVVYLLANVVLNTLNWYWFVKMIKAVRKRFEPPKPGKREALPAGAVPRTKASALEGKDRMTVRHRRAPSIEDVVPDSEELREGTIQ